MGYSGRYGIYKEKSCCAFSIALILIGIFITCILAYFIRREQRKKKDLTRYSKVLITGGATSIGRELALLFARDYKCHVIILDSDDSNSNILLSHIKVKGGKGHFYKCDFKDRNMILRTIAQILADFNSIDIFVNTGGLTLEKSFDDYCYEEILAIMEANFFGPTILTKEILPIMKAQGKGHIVNVPSHLEIFDSQDVLAYCGTKTAFSKVLQGLQAELKLNGSNIKITVAKPLFAVTEKTAGKQIEADKNVLKPRVKAYAEKVFKGIIYEDQEI